MGVILKMANRKQLQTFGFEQTIDEQYWHWSDDEKKIHFTDPQSIMKRICSRIHLGLQAAGATGDALKFEFAAINHDSDVEEDGGVFTPIRAHIHGVVTLASKRDMTVIAQWVGLDLVKIEIPRGRYGRENMLAYLIHAKDPEKHQYSPAEVETFGTFDYMAYYKGKKTTWDKRKAVVRTKNNKEAAEWLKAKVQTGEMTIPQIMEDLTYKYVYADNMQLLEEAAKFYAMDKGYTALKEFKDGKYDMTVLFVTGESNVGKSHFAKEICKALEHMYGWRTHEASAAHPLDGYDGQEIIFVDEARPYTFGAPEWLLMLQPGSQTLKARFNNKRRAHKVVVVTSPVNDPYEFFSQVKGSNQEKEPLNQFIRRLTGHIHVMWADDRMGRIAQYNKVARSKHAMLYDEKAEYFRVPANLDVDYLENGIPLMDSGIYDDYKESKTDTRMRKVDFALVPFVDAPVNKKLVDIGPDNEVIVKDAVMKQVLLDVHDNIDPDREHDVERPLVEKVLGEKQLVGMATTLGLGFKKSEGVE